MTDYREQYRNDPTYRHRTERAGVSGYAITGQEIEKARDDLAAKYNIHASSIELNVEHEDNYGSLDIFIEASYYSKITPEDIKKEEEDKQHRLFYERKQYEELKKKFEGA